jgi:hypothetical protein
LERLTTHGGKGMGKRLKSKSEKGWF